MRKIFVGSYGQGVSIAGTDPGTGLPGPLAAATADLPNPSFLALSVDGRTLYAVNEETDGTVGAFAVGAGGTLRPLGTRATHGADPCHVHAHPDGRHVLVANYTSGSVSVYQIGADGGLGEATEVLALTGSGPDPQRQEGPHAHQVRTDPAGRFTHVVDLGTDSVHGYRVRAEGTLEPAVRSVLRPGSGPRHLVFHPSGEWAYLANELDATLTVCGYDQDSGRLTPGSAVPTAPTPPPGGDRVYPSEIVLSADAGTLYVANRGHDSVAVFAVDGGRVTPRGTVPGGGNWPRHLALSLDGRFLYVANQRSDGLATFEVGAEGGLRPTGPVVGTDAPAMVLPLPG